MPNMYPTFLQFAQSFLKLLKKFNWEGFLIVVLVLISIFALFYNLEMNPRTWHDEGAAMLLARTLAEDGVYAVRNSDGYQTFGPVQSVGPTVILPVALSFKLFGVGILQGRLVAVIYTCLTLFIIHKLAKSLFGFPHAFLGILFLFGSTSSQFLFFGRQTLGEVPALGFFMGGWYFWFRGRQNHTKGSYLISGVLIGLAMITKSSYAGICGVLLVALVLLDIFYFKQRSYFSVILVTGIAFAVFFPWVLFQRSYFGLETFQKNADLLAQLARATTGFSISGIQEQAKFLIGSKNDYFYFLWGIPAFIYAVTLCLRRDEYGFLTSALTIFAVLWLAYYFYSVPWPAYLFAPSTIASLFLGKLWFETLSRLKVPFEKVSDEIMSGSLINSGLWITLFAGLLLSVLYPLQNAIQFNVLSKNSAQQQVVDFINQDVERGETIETWERELGILTDHRYHYPDQSLLIEVHAAKYRENLQDYLLSSAYFESVKPSYVVIGRFAKEFPVYDPIFLSRYGILIAEIGNGDLESYEIYKISYP